MKLQLSRNFNVDLDEIHQYTRDLDRVTLLRDKCRNPEEKARYDIILECMQKVLEYLHEANFPVTK
jgi:hypothetical protein